MSISTKRKATAPEMLDQKIRRAKVVLRELKSILEDLEDRRELAAAKKRNADKPTVALHDVAKELGL